MKLGLILHSVRFFGKDVDDHLLVLRFPLFIFGMRIDGRLDILLDVPSLFALFMKGNRAENQSIEDILDIGFRSAGDAYAQIRKL